MLGPLLLCQAFAGAPHNPTLFGAVTDRQFKVKGSHSVNGQLKYTSNGTLATSFLGHMDHGMNPFVANAGNLFTLTYNVPADAPADVPRSRFAAYIAWNNVVLNKVDRWLITEDFDAKGASLGPARCQYYHDKNPNGCHLLPITSWCTDPIVMMDEQFNLVPGTTPPFYKYGPKKLPNSNTQFAYMTTDGDGGPATRIDVNTTAGSEYRQEYYDPRPVDRDVFNFYKKYADTCVTVETFTAADICFDGWLQVEYGCP